MPKRVAILGSTGSIGRQALQVIEAYPDRFEVAALAANSNIELLAAQANRHTPRVVSAGNPSLAAELARQLTFKPETIAFGPDGLLSTATRSGADVVLAATDGMVALQALVESIERGMHVALANKELLVSAGRFLCDLARARGARIVPVDSEHSALFQCLIGERIADVASVVLTASGGPFWGQTLEQMESATPEQALRHPTWSMGAKNTLDSATLMNKGLEIIEASHLFNLPAARIQVVVHRQSIVHGFVAFADGNVKAQLAAPDMRLPIGFALAYPERLPGGFVDVSTKNAIGLGHALSSLSFEPIDEGRFPAVRLAYAALAAGGTSPAVLSAVNEEAGRAFLQKKIKFTEICPIVERALAKHPVAADGLEEIEAADRWGRAFARDAISAAMQR
ncbi:MAG: 1-deoxy-D-xylulose-5-phosphate reductoisomerase [Candidatus Eremiobacteraeota bacterium]|nr:1-deoxy-D-xylulose-5-phosphate reductoisomerase [Candidatus Eremiobacteraeota bacterium]